MTLLAKATWKGIAYVILYTQVHLIQFVEHISNHMMIAVALRFMIDILGITCGD